MDLMNVKDESRFATTGGELSVMIYGAHQMQTSFVGNLDSLGQVNLLMCIIVTCSLKIFILHLQELLHAPMLTLVGVLEPFILTMSDALALSSPY